MGDRTHAAAHTLSVLVAAALVGCAADPGVEAPALRSPMAPRRARVAPPPLTLPLRVAAMPEHADVMPVVGLVAANDPLITKALADGVRLAFAEARARGGPTLSLLVGEHETRWGSGAAAAVRMALDDGAVAVIAPPERRRAHEIAQFGTRAGVPVISTSPFRTVTQAGSTWVISVVPVDCVVDASVADTTAPEPGLDATTTRAFADAFRAAYDRAPEGWNAVGYDAGRALVVGVQRHGLRRRGLTLALAAGEAFAGAWGSVWIAPSGARGDVAAPDRTSRRSP